MGQDVYKRQGTWATNLKTNLEANGKDGELVALPPIAEVGQYLDLSLIHI